jgi:hypothetical protein
MSGVLITDSTFRWRGGWPLFALPVDDLEDRRVTMGGEVPFASRPNSTIDLIVGIVEEPLDLRTGDRLGRGGTS